MPRFDFKCPECGSVFEGIVKSEVRTVACLSCGCRDAWRQFHPTVNILVPEHFRRNQRDFLPPKGDKAWDKIEMGSGSQSHAKPSAGEQLAKELKSV
jgi:putative FmdB family regulatory protein